VRPVRAVQVEVDIRPYRIGLLERIAARDDIDFAIYSGLAAPGQGSPEEPPEVAVPVHRVRNLRWPGQPLKVFWQVGALKVLRSNAEVIVCNEVVSNLSVWAIRLLHRVFGKKLVLIGFFYRPQRELRFQPVRSWFRRRLRSSASALVAYTRQGRQELLAEGEAPEKVFVNGNTLDTTRLYEIAGRVTEHERLTVRRQWDLPNDAVVSVFLGRLRAVKRVEVAIEANRVLNGRVGPPHSLVIIGDGEERQHLESAAAGASVRFVGQTYDDAEIARLLSVGSFLVMPGSVGLTCVHGFANGLPCVTTSDAATTQTPEFAYVEDGYNGIVLPAPDPHLFAEAISDLVEHPEKLVVLREGALETARRLDMGHMADKFVAAMRFARDGG
jgi:glycosyltransferase involved in cell wall biosynthesis